MTKLDDQKKIDQQFKRILRTRDIRAEFQPIVDLPSHSVVGYEALARGPEGSALVSPRSLLAAANRAGRLVEFDWVARASACSAALEAGLGIDYVLLLNIEPIVLDSECPRDLWPTIERACHTLRVVLEVTERSLDRDPGTLLEGVERQRPRVAGIGLDDVGSHPATVAMLPLVAPNVIKIDRRVVQAAPGEDVAHILSAVHGAAERTGAVVLAEGVEISDHRHYALAQGARLGQGHLFGRPGPLPTPMKRSRHRAPLRRLSAIVVETPFDALSGQVDGTASGDFLLTLTKHFSSYVDRSLPALYISLLPRPDLLDETEMRRLAGLARAGAFAAVLGPDLPFEPGQGVRGTGQQRDLPPRDEWAAIAIGPYLSAAVLARRTLAEDEWLYAVTHDQQRVVAAARSLVRLLGPPEPRYSFEA